MIILANGTYDIPSSADTQFSRTANATNPIIMRAEQVGGVKITGGADWVFSGCQYVTWYGFIHNEDDTGGTSGHLHFDGGHHNRLARCEISLVDHTTRMHYVYCDNSKYWLCDHCYFHDKDTKGYYIGFTFGSNNTQAEGPIVEYCRFRNHTQTKEADNGDSGECVMMGSSSECRTYFRITMRYCYIDNNTGDGEVVGFKSSGNLVYHCSFVNNDAALSFRHGDTNKAIGNYFEATGLRLGGADNVVANNFITLIPSGRREARRGLVLNNGDAERPTAQGANYERVVDNTIVYNTFANGSGTSEWVVGWGGYNGGSLKPTSNVFRGNIMKCQNGNLFSFENGATASGNTITNNIGHVTSNGSYADFSTAMGDRADPGIAQESDGVWRITGTGSLAHHYNSNTSNIFSSTTTEDFDGQARGSRSDAGCDHYNASTVVRLNKRIVASDTGPSASTVIGSGTGTTIPTDSFGAPKKYPDSTLGASAPAVWEMGIGNYNSRIGQWTAGSGGAGFVGSGTSIYFDSDQGTSNVRWIVYASQSTSYSLTTGSRETIINRADTVDSVKRGGYMADGSNNKNWRDCEITSCVYLYDMGGDNDFGWFCRGGTHSGADGIGVSREGSCYHPAIFYATGDSECAKEQWHTSYVSGRAPDSKTVIGNCVGQWVWVKFIFRNLPASGAYASPFASLPHIPVKTEIWAIRTGLTDPAVLPNVSTATNVSSWQKVMERTDSGGQGTVGNQNDCGPGPVDAILSYGGPMVTFRADRDSSNTGYGHIRVCYTSVREIKPDATAYW